MSYFNRRLQAAVVTVLKQEELDAAKKREPLIKADSEPMQQTSAANQASTQAYQTTYPDAPPVAGQIKAHKAAAALHGAAAKAHRQAGQAVMKDTPNVGAAYYQQAQQHDSAQQSHENQAQNMQDQQDCGYR